MMVYLSRLNSLPREDTFIRCVTSFLFREHAAIGLWHHILAGNAVKNPLWDWIIDVFWGTFNAEINVISQKERDLFWIYTFKRLWDDLISYSEVKVNLKCQYITKCIVRNIYDESCSFYLSITLLYLII